MELFGTSAGTISHTLTINSIESDIFPYFRLVDTPGFKDNRGTEIDVSNSICITRALQRCKSARIILLINYHELKTDRAQGIKETLKIVKNYIKDI